MNPTAENPRRKWSHGHRTEPDPSLKPEPSLTGTRRRLQALAARSWSPDALERETAIPAGIIRRELDGYDELAPELAGEIAAAYDRLWDRPPPSATAEDRKAAAETAECAARSGWAPPMAWDDDRIDLPSAGPEPGWRPSQRVRLRAVDIAEDAEFVREHDGLRQASAREVAMRLGIEQNRLEKATSRARQYAARRAGRAGRDAEPEAEAG